MNFLKNNAEKTKNDREYRHIDLKAPTYDTFSYNCQYFAQDFHCNPNKLWDQIKDASFRKTKEKENENSLNRNPFKISAVDLVCLAVAAGTVFVLYKKLKKEKKSPIFRQKSNFLPIILGIVVISFLLVKKINKCFTELRKRSGKVRFA